MRPECQMAFSLLCHGTRGGRGGGKDARSLFTTFQFGCDAGHWSATTKSCKNRTEFVLSDQGVKRVELPPSSTSLRPKHGFTVSNYPSACVLICHWFNRKIQRCSSTNQRRGHTDFQRTQKGEEEEEEKKRRRRRRGGHT